MSCITALGSRRSSEVQIKAFFTPLAGTPFDLTLYVLSLHVQPSSCMRDLAWTAMAQKVQYFREQLCLSLNNPIHYFYNHPHPITPHVQPHILSTIPEPSYITPFWLTLSSSSVPYCFLICSYHFVFNIFILGHSVISFDTPYPFLMTPITSCTS